MNIAGVVFHEGNYQSKLSAGFVAREAQLLAQEHHKQDKAQT